MSKCPHPLDAIKANEWNRVVQCHRCGHVFDSLYGEDWEYGEDASRADTKAGE